MQAVVVGLVQRLQNLLGHDFRKVGKEVGKVVEVHACGRGDEFLGLHTFDQAIADLVVKFDENVALVLGRDHFPQYGAFLERKRFEETCYFGRVQAVHHQPRGTHAAAVELLAQQLQVALGMLSRFHGSCPDSYAGPGMGQRLRQECNRKRAGNLLRCQRITDITALYGGC